MNDESMLTLCSTGNFSAPSLTEAGPSAALPRIQATIPATALASYPLQPVRDVVAYLRDRKPQPDPANESDLFMALPKRVKLEVAALLSAFKMVARRVREKMSVSRACAAVVPLFRDWHWSLKRFRSQFDIYQRTKDWLCLVNRACCPACWRKTSVGLPPAFIEFCAERFGQYKRSDGKRQALMSIKRQWKTGRNDQGREQIIPGYENGWTDRVREIFPDGWHYSNILRQLKKSGSFTPAIRAFMHEGEAAAREMLPQILGTRRGLRFLERVTFDDVRTDWKIFNPRSGASEELWLLVARDEATAMVLGFVAHPASEREDGRCTHLGLAQMKQLAGWLLERYPLPPYVMTWKIERGTATLSEAMKLALGELFGHRIAVSYTSMIGSASSPAGYREKKKGNSRGKASHESHNRLFHTQGSFIPGQTGASYGLRPADLVARETEAVEIWQMRERLPEHLRGREQYPLLTLKQAREHLYRICGEQNLRTEHKLEDFEEVLEWFDGSRWQPQNTCPAIEVPKRRRMEMPLERAARLAHGYEFTPVSPDIVATFYEHTEKIVTVEANGEIEFDHERRKIKFSHGGLPLVPGTKALAYYHPDDPKFLHLTDGKGAVLGTWLRRDRVQANDRDALAEAMRYTHVARETARAAANVLATPERNDLAAMRANNAELLKLADFTDVTEPPPAANGTIGSPVGAALTAVAKVVKADRITNERQAAADDSAAAERLLNALRSKPQPE